jgi:SAM-dependent methyltransferase
MSQLNDSISSSFFSREVLSCLRCTSCRNPLETSGAGYRCANCGKQFPDQNGVARFVDPENYADSFGFQWKRYARTQLDSNEVRESEHHFRIKTGLTPADLKEKLVLDVGCGMGRFAEVATRWGARVVGIDLSAAAEVAARNLASRDFVAFQADVFHLPFELESFDCIYSLGVLHHTPDCEAAVKVLPQFLKPGGAMAIWLYSGYNKWFRFTDIYRNYTHRMSAPALHRLLSVAVPFFYHLNRGLRVIPIVGKPVAGLVHHVFPVNRQQDPEARLLDTFDWYSPRYQSKHTYEQVFRWFESSGLEDLHVAETPISVRGRKPASGLAREERRPVSHSLAV